MEILLYLSAAIAAIALVILVVYVVITLKAAKETMSEVSSTMKDLQKQVEGVTTETTQLLTKTNRLADDLNHKSAKVDGLFESAQGISLTINDFNESLRQLSTTVAKYSREDQEKAAQAVKWGSTIFDYVNKMKKEK